MYLVLNFHVAPPVHFQLTGFNFQQHGGVTMERQEPDDDLDQDMDGLDESRQDEARRPGGDGLNPQLSF
ncbi:hypothetical protein F2Q68_00045156 [Brassica cretica]|uniref:Uncharacterized protein n=1 Tax=Brassica cretica TaxID=69181 RepID=A0A8S9LNU0_BRACR|nr:hypothetical protein F2Q68_00045156 [Brassica cretica]